MGKQLRYVGADPSTDWVAGWPASNHEEQDAELAAEKVASGLYEEQAPPAEKQGRTRGAGKE